jgi:ABC-type transport system involved in multi-copper enzyme maturation permease subunit
MRIIQQSLAIARTTVVESIQQPVAFLIFASGVLSTLLVPVFQFHRFSEDGRLARDSGFSTLMVFGLALAVTTAGRAVAVEITRGTAAAIIGKPVARAIFVFSKWLGVCGVILLFWLGMTAATLLAERGSAHLVVSELCTHAQHGADDPCEATGYVMDSVTLTLGICGVLITLLFSAFQHYAKRRRFGVSAFVGIAISQLTVVVLCGFNDRMGHLRLCLSNAPTYVSDLDWRILSVSVLVLFALLIFAALATALATRLQTGAVLAVCVLVLLIGLAGDLVAGNAALLSVQGVLAGILPDIQHFWMCDALAQGGRLSWDYVLEAGLYALGCCTLFITTGCISFANRDLG